MVGEKKVTRGKDIKVGVDRGSMDIGMFREPGGEDRWVAGRSSPGYRSVEEGREGYRSSREGSDLSLS